MPNVAAPFAHEGTFRKGNSNLTYIATPEAIERLNVCFGYGNWAFRALESFRDGDFIVCRGELSIKTHGEWVTYCQYGGQEINRKRANGDGTPGDIIDLADDYKGAASDAMKKCASHFGLGLYLALKRQPTSWSPNELDPAGPASGSAGGAGPKSDAPAPPEVPPASGESSSGEAVSVQSPSLPAGATPATAGINQEKGDVPSPSNAAERNVRDDTTSDLQVGTSEGGDGAQGSASSPPNEDNAIANMILRKFDEASLLKPLPVGKRAAFLAWKSQQHIPPADYEAAARAKITELAGVA